MKYIIEEKIKNLELQLKHYKKPPHTYKNKKVEDDEKLWNASLFFARILLESNYSGLNISKTELREFTVDYEKGNKHPINLEYLFSKFWLRMVFGNIYIPSLIRKTARDYESKKDRYNELLFINYIKTDLKIDEAISNEIDDLITSYESTHTIKLDKNWLLDSQYFKIEEDNSVIKINSVDHYKQLLDNWATFKFINELLKHKQVKYKNPILIKKIAFREILSQHKGLYPKTPSINDLIEDKIIADTGKSYILSTRSGNSNCIFELAGPIKAIIWQKLLDDNSFENDTKRLLKFLSYTKYDDHRHNIVTHLSIKAKIRFKETALAMVLNEPDLYPIEQEFDKVYLEDEITSRNYWNNSIKIKGNDLKPTDDIYDLYDQMLKVSDNYNGNLFFMQESRANLSYLIDELLVLDKDHPQKIDSKKITYPHYPITKQFLLEGRFKPYLLWKTSYFLKTRGLTRLPYFLIEKKLAPFTFRLLDNTEIEILPDETISQVRTKMLKIAIQLIFDEITSAHNFDKNHFTNIVFQIFKEINRDKFQLIQNSRTIELYEQNVADKKEREHVLLSTIENYSQDINSYPKKSSISIISQHLTFLLERSHNYLPSRELSNGSWHLQLNKLNYLSWLSQVAINCQLKREKLDKNIEQKIAEVFLESYLSAIEKVSIAKTDYSSLKLIDMVPSWYLENEQLDNIKWIFPFILLKRNNIFSKFLNPLIEFNSEGDIYDDFNQYSAKRLRSHLFIFLSALNSINNQNSNLIRLNKETKKIKYDLEAGVLEILKKNAIQHEKYRIDILDEFFERSFKSSNKSELIPQIANSINWFSDKKKIVNVITKTSDLTRLLIIVDWITAEGLKKELIKKIKKSKITKSIKLKRWIPEIELIITKLTYHPKLVKQTKEALDYWTKNVTTHGKKDLEKLTFLVELMLAYNDKNESILDAIEVPEHTSYKVHKEFEVDSYKQFFRGLIRFDKNPESAYQIFDNLHHQFTHHSTIALNRFAAKINWASKTKTDTLFEEALDEWNEMKLGLPEIYLENIKDNIWTNQLTAHYHLNNKTEFDKLYLSIPFPYQMKEDMVELKIGMLLNNQLWEDAKRVLFRATEYHKDSSGRIPKFIRNLKIKLDDETDIKFLQNNFNEIFASDPKTLIQIFPNRLNAENKLGSFISREVALASSKMLDKINAVRDVRLEDKYNDLVQLALDARISQWGWQIKDQTRGAFSANQNKYNPGERDIMICDSNGEGLLVCEAFIWKDIATAKSHINKIFNYHHKRKNFIILIYDKRSHKNFGSNWDKYKNEVVPNLSYPTEFSLKKFKWKELTKKFEYDSTGIKIGATKHGKGTKIFHIMVNLNYRVK